MVSGLLFYYFIILLFYYLNINNLEYLTPNKTVARTREVDLLLDGFIVYLAIEDQTSRKRISSILLSHGAFWYSILLSSTTHT